MNTVDCEHRGCRSLPVHAVDSFCVRMKDFVMAAVCIYGEAVLYAK